MKTKPNQSPKPEADIVTTALAYAGYRVIAKQLEQCDRAERRLSLAGDKAGVRAVRKRRKNLSNALFDWAQIGEGYTFDFSAFA